MSKLWVILSGIIGFLGIFAFVASSGCGADTVLNTGVVILSCGAICWGIIYFLGLALALLLKVPGCICRWFKMRAKRRTDGFVVNRQVHNSMRYDSIKYLAYTILLGTIIFVIFIGLSYLVGYLHMLIVC